MAMSARKRADILTKAINLIEEAAKTLRPLDDDRVIRSVINDLEGKSRIKKPPIDILYKRFEEALEDANLEER